MIGRRRFLRSIATSAALTGAGRLLAAGTGGESAAPARAASRDPLAGRLYFKDSTNYEALRQAASWNARKPNRFPEAIVLAESEADVVAAVMLARERGWQVTARSGGHSWTSSHTRDKSVQINLARMKDINVDVDKGIVAVSPAVYGNVLNKKLREEHQLFTPTAHGVNVGIGGFVMCGGHGWNSRVFGLGCENLQALDVVTAEGKLIHANETQNSDYYWAARGSGPGYFGVATRYYLKLHKKPPVMRSSGFVFDANDIETVVGWVRQTMSTFPRILEVVMIGTAPEGTPTLMMLGNCLGDTDEEVDSALACQTEVDSRYRSTLRCRAADRIRSHRRAFCRGQHLDQCFGGRTRAAAAALVREPAHCEVVYLLPVLGTRSQAAGYGLFRTGGPLHLE
jgi:FAD/FMN-containing dehydrogenase